MMTGVMLAAAGFAIPAMAAAQEPAPARFESEVRVYGSLRAMMHDNQTASQVKLAAVRQPHLFGLGALEDLSGEVLIVDGEIYLSTADGEHAATTAVANDTQRGAALLVTAAVDRWDGFVVDRDIAWEEFDATLEKWIELLGWDPQQRLPFQIVGRFPMLQWHVIDGDRLQGGGGSHEDHLQAASRLEAEGVEARVFGFYSPEDQGVFTHHNSVSHMHCLTTHPQQMGHVDGMIVPAGARVLLPSLEEPHARQLVEDILDGLGSPAARQAIQSLTTEAECSGPSGEFTTRTQSIRPHAVYFEQVSSRGTSRVWSVPHAAWGLDQSGSVTELPSRVRPFVRGHEFHLMLLDLPRRFAGFRLLGSESQDGVAGQRIAMHDEFGYPATMLVREQQPQLVELVLHPPGAEGAIVIEPHTWKESDAVRWFRGFVLTEGVDRVFRYRYTRVEPNTVAAEFFERPAETPESEASR